MRSSFFIRTLAFATALLAALPAAATFHLWQMRELYSSADGKVQFLELSALSGGQEFVAQHTITATQGSVTRSFTIPGNLPGDSAGRRFLVGTESFQALAIPGGFRADFVVPDNFFFLGNGTINFGEFSDLWNYSGLPSDGTLSLGRDGSTATNSPGNFSGNNGTVVLPAATALNFQALWYRAPAESEAGWGVNVTHQGDILFATWFTYDTDGSGMWLVMSAGAKTGTNTYSGALYRTLGPAFNANPWSPSGVTVTPVGTATFAFTDANSGTFTYTVNGITQSKPITRQIFSSPVPNCTAGGSPGAAPNYQDLWWRAPAESESGWGVNLTHQGDILFATWFTYGADGRGMWLVMSAGLKTGPTTYSGALYRTTGPAFNANPWSPAGVTVTQVGTATFNFTDGNNGTFSYTVNGISQSKPITRQVYSSPATVCR
jgi:hypothetical protein